MSKRINRDSDQYIDPRQLISLARNEDYIRLRFSIKEWVNLGQMINIVHPGQSAITDVILLHANTTELHVIKKTYVGTEDTNRTHKHKTETLVYHMNELNELRWCYHEGILYLSLIVEEGK